MSPVPEKFSGDVLSVVGATQIALKPSESMMTAASEAIEELRPQPTLSLYSSSRWASLRCAQSDGRVSSLTELSSAVLRAWQRRLYVPIEGDPGQLGAGRGPGRRRASPPSFKRSAFQRLRFRRRPARRRTRHDRAHRVGDSACTRDCGRGARSHPVGPLDAAIPLSTSRGHSRERRTIRCSAADAQRPVKVIDFLLVGHIEPAIKLDDLKHMGVFRGGPPQSISQLTEERFEPVRDRMAFGFAV
jgi:hypothetical protein